MLFRTLRSHLAIGLTFATLAFHQSVLAYEQDGDDYNYLVDYLDMASLSIGSLESREDLRAVGTFWNVQKARKFNKRQALKDSEGGCGVVIYYEQMHIRREAFNRKIHDGELARWMRPFAIAPICTDEARPKDLTDFPRRNDQGHKSLVFHNLRQNSNWDSYLVLNKLDRDDQNDCINMEAFKGQHIQWGAKALDGIGPIWGADLDENKMREWASIYTHLMKKDCVPNPYKFGQGHHIWTEWSPVNNYWGNDGLGRIFELVELVMIEAPGDWLLEIFMPTE